MILVDSSTWADFFNGADNPHVHRLVQALRLEEDLAVIPLIITEVLQGFRSEQGFSEAGGLLMALPVIEPAMESYVEAARLFRRLRRKGVTVRGAVDCLIAQTCMDTGIELLSPDSDFVLIARHSPLRLWSPETP